VTKKVVGVFVVFSCTASGALGTLLVVFATDGGLLYGGGFNLLGVQSIRYFNCSMGNICVFIVLLS
jgi:Amt family ammonium transporter